MYSDHFEGIHPTTQLAYIVLFPATSGPGDVWPVHWKTYVPHPGDLVPPPFVAVHLFSTPDARRAWWVSVRRDILWVRMPTTNSQLAYREQPDYHWLDLTDGLLPEKKGSTT